MDARRSFRPSASLFSARSAASDAYSTKLLGVTNAPSPLTTSRPSGRGAVGKGPIDGTSLAAYPTPIGQVDLLPL
jgi:hypothetical protein